MKFSVLAPAPSIAAARNVAALVAEHEASGFWSTQGDTVDAMTALAVVGSDVADLELGTAVVPIQGRHPMVMAQQALTTNEQLDGRLNLGLGVSHRPFIEETWGLPYDGAVEQMGEYLSVLLPLLDGRSVEHAGENWTMNGRIETAGPRPRVFLSALGPRMAELAGSRADGVITWFVGARSLATVIVPAIERGAEAAGRSRPQLVSGFPICVTDDAPAARKVASSQYGGLAALPTYQRTLAREGAESPADLALIGSAPAVHERLNELASLGVDNVMADVFGTADERGATLELLAGRQKRDAEVIDVRDVGAAVLDDAGNR